MLELMFELGMSSKEIYELSEIEVEQIIKSLSGTESNRHDVNKVLVEEISSRNEMDEQLTFVDTLDWRELIDITFYNRQIEILTKLGWNESSWQSGNKDPYNQDLTEKTRTELLTNNFSIDFINDFY